MTGQTRANLLKITGDDWFRAREEALTAEPVRHQARGVAMAAHRPVNIGFTSAATSSSSTRKSDLDREPGLHPFFHRFFFVLFAISCFSLFSPRSPILPGFTIFRLNCSPPYILRSLYTATEFTTYRIEGDKSRKKRKEKSPASHSRAVDL